MITKESPIGVIDSGIGGFSVARKVQKLMPHENLLYLGDGANTPYGNHSAEEILTMTRYMLRFMEDHGVKALLATLGAKGCFALVNGERIDVPGFAVETVDTCVGRVVDATLKMGGIAMITADHGNAEQMTEPDGSPMTAHTTNPVPFILCGAGTELRPDGRLADIAPTMLDVMGLACPPEMDGQTLIVK